MKTRNNKQKIIPGKQKKVNSRPIPESKGVHAIFQKKKVRMGKKC